MAMVVDPEGVEATILDRLVALDGLRVLEIGCGEGRLTTVIAPRAASVLALDPDEERIEDARSSVPAAIAEKVRFEAASAVELDVPRHAFDLALFSWSL